MQFWKHLCLAIVILSTIARPVFAQDTPAPQEAHPAASVGRETPRDTFKRFMLAATNLAEATPEQIDLALSCLDLRDLNEETRKQQGVILAEQLESLLGGLDPETIPERPDDFEVTILAHADNEDHKIVLRQDSEQQWRFTAATLQAVPAMHAEKQKTEAPTKQAAEQAAESIAANRRSPQRTVIAFLNAMNTTGGMNLAEARNCLDLSEIDAPVLEEVGSERAKELLWCMNRIGLVIPASLSDDPNATSPVKVQSYEPRNVTITLRKIESGVAAGEWRFSTKTIAQVPDLAKYFLEIDKPRVQAVMTEPEGLVNHLSIRQYIPAVLQSGRIWRLEYWQWIALVAFALAGVIASRMTDAIANFILSRQLRRLQVYVDDASLASFVRPIGLLAMTALWWWGLNEINLEAVARTWLLGTVKFVSAVLAVWSLFSVIELLARYFGVRAGKTQSRFDDLLVPLISKGLKVLVTAAGLLFVTSVMGWNITGVLTGLGIGGLAIAFAAKEALGNVLGSIAILLDRPFEIGDWVKIGDAEGTIESVGFRSTRIRTFYNSLISIPNADCINKHIDNMGARKYRRFKTQVSVAYHSSPEQLEAMCEGMRELIRNHKYTRKDYFQVYVNNMAANSIDILLYCFFETPDWSLELRERHRLILDIMRLANKLQVEFAFPTQTLHVFNEGQLQIPEIEAATPNEAVMLGRDLAKRIASPD